MLSRSFARCFTCLPSESIMEIPRERGRRPCDQCRRRKVRCDYLKPCHRCQTARLLCTAMAVRKKRGRKPGSGVVVEQLQKEMSLDNEDHLELTESTSPSPPEGVNTSSAISKAQNRPSSSPEHHAGLPAASPSADSHNLEFAQLQSPDESVEAAARTSDLAWPSGVLPNGGFYTFNDFAQSVLNPSSTPWHSNLDAANGTRWGQSSPGEDYAVATAVLSPADMEHENAAYHTFKCC